MDHVPLPNNAYLNRFEVPFLYGQQYDGGSFQNYPERVGWVANRNVKPTMVLVRQYSGITERLVASYNPGSVLVC